jgi:hypothetical protein
VADQPVLARRTLLAIDAILARQARRSILPVGTWVADAAQLARLTV